MIDLMKANETLVFQVGKSGSNQKFTVSFHDFDEIYEEAAVSKFADKK